MNAIEFVKDNPIFFKLYLEKYGSWSIDQIKKYSTEITWSHLALNENIEWNIDLIERLKHLIYWYPFKIKWVKCVDFADKS